MNKPIVYTAPPSMLRIDDEDSAYGGKIILLNKEDYTKVVKYEDYKQLEEAFGQAYSQLASWYEWSKFLTESLSKDGIDINKYQADVRAVETVQESAEVN